MGQAKTETGTLEEVGLVAERVSLSMTSTQAALLVIFLSSSSLNLGLSQTFFVSSLSLSHRQGPDVFRAGKQALSDLEDEPGNHSRSPFYYQPKPQPLG